jgi:protein disulfide-isomerase A1
LTLFFINLRQLSPAFTVVKADKIDSYIASAKVVVLGYFTASASKDRTLFEQIAQNLRDDFTFGIVEDEKVLKKEGVKGHKMIMYKKFDEPKIDYSGDFTKEAIVEFLETKSIPIMVRLLFLLTVFLILLFHSLPVG